MIKDFGNFLESVGSEPTASQETGHFAWKFFLEMLQNRALWANFIQIGALHSSHEKPPIWHCFQ